LTFRPLSEAFIRRSWYSVLPILDTTGRCRVRESGRMRGHEPWWGQLPTEPRVRPLSWHGIFPSCQESEELSISFFWRRPLIEVETSSFLR